LNIDFNNVRKQAMHRHNELIKFLAINTSKYDGLITISSDSVRDIIGSLGDNLVGICATYEDGNDDFKCVLDDNLERLHFDEELENVRQ